MTKRWSTRAGAGRGASAAVVILPSFDFCASAGFAASFGFCGALATAVFDVPAPLSIIAHI